MRNINAATLNQLLDYSFVVEGLDRLHREDTNTIQDILLSQEQSDRPSNHLLVRAAWQHDKFIGIKLASVFPENVSNGKIAIHAAYILFDGINGVPLANIDGTALTHFKTACDSALGSQYLSCQQSAHLLMVGAGAMAQHLIAAHCAVRPGLKQITIWNRTRERAESVSNLLKDNPSISECAISVTDNLEASARSADIICCATMSASPIIDGAWLKPGCHLDLVGAFKADMREANDECLKRSSVFVDSRHTTIGEIGELLIPIKTGVISEADVKADLYNLCRHEHSGRQNDNEITLFKNGGGGHLDLMTARLAMERLDG